MADDDRVTPPGLHFVDGVARSVVHMDPDDSALHVWIDQLALQRAIDVLTRLDYPGAAAVVSEVLDQEIAKGNH